MINKGHVNAEEIKIQGVIDRYLKFRTAKNNTNDNHLDEDSLTAFVEGRVSENESTSLVKHLIDCTFCLNVTGELAKMNAAFAEDQVSVAIPTKEPVRVSEILGGILTRIFGSNDGAVFAHEEKNDSEKTEEDKKDKEIS
jgi:hypothetical protein